MERTNTAKKYETISDKTLTNIMTEIATILPKVKIAQGVGFGLIDGYYTVEKISDSKIEKVRNICITNIGQPLESLDEITLHCISELRMLPGALTIQQGDMIFHKREKTELCTEPTNYFAKLRNGEKPNQNTLEIYSTL